MSHVQIDLTNDNATNVTNTIDAIDLTRVDQYEGLSLGTPDTELVRYLEQCEGDGLFSAGKRRRLEGEPQGQDHVDGGRRGTRTPETGRLGDSGGLQLRGEPPSAFKLWGTDSTPANGVPSGQGDNLGGNNQEASDAFRTPGECSAHRTVPRGTPGSTELLLERGELLRMGGTNGIRASSPVRAREEIRLGGHPEGNPRRYGYRRPEDEVLRKLRVARRILDEVCGMVQGQPNQERSSD